MWMELATGRGAEAPATLDGGQPRDPQQTQQFPNLFAFFHFFVCKHVMADYLLGQLTHLVPDAARGTLAELPFTDRVIGLPAAPVPARVTACRTRRPAGAPGTG